MASGIAALIKRRLTVKSLQEYHEEMPHIHDSSMPILANEGGSTR
jgi:hypothetical protein